MSRCPSTLHWEAKVSIGNPNILENIRNLAGAGPDLSSFAAEDAVETLLENWKAALRDGMDLRALVSDLEGVIGHLSIFRDRIIEAYPSAQPEPQPDYAAQRNLAEQEEG